MITTYILTRHQNKSLVLCPYLDTERLDVWKGDEDVVLKSSGMLTKNQQDEATVQLYSAIDFSVDRWVQNKQYIPRLLVSAVVFTIAYFILSLAIRDPIPMVDEILISTALTIFTWRSLARRDTRSSIAQRRRYELKLKASGRTEVIDESLFAFETFLDEASKADPMQLCKWLCNTGVDSPISVKLAVEVDMLQEVSNLLFLSVRTYDKSLYRTAETLAQLRASGKSNDRLAAQLFHLNMQNRLDLGLLALVSVLFEAV